LYNKHIDTWDVTTTLIAGYRVNCCFLPSTRSEKTFNSCSDSFNLIKLQLHRAA
jgi:hypothetical protein